MKRINHGWLYREPPTGSNLGRIRVQLKGDSRPYIFEDNRIGAQEAADFITAKLGDAWKLEDLAFLGYRIITEERETSQERKTT